MIRQTIFVSLLLVFVSGCWLGNDEVWGKVDDVPDDTIVRIGAVDPESGSTSGGFQVTIDASPLGDPVRVWFGDQEATYLTHSKNQVLVEAPAASGTGYVSITIESNDREGTADNAFYYTDGSGFTDSDTGTW